MNNATVFFYAGYAINKKIEKVNFFGELCINHSEIGGTKGGIVDKLICHILDKYDGVECAQDVHIAALTPLLFVNDSEEKK